MAESEHPPTNHRAAVYGEALRRLRRQGGMRQAEAAAAAGLSQAAWAKYEGGTTLAFLNLLNQEKCVQALGRTLADLEAMRAIVEAGEHDTPFATAPMAGLFGVHEAAPAANWLDGDTRRMLCPDDTMHPYVEAGDMVVYSLSAAPLPDRGVVIVRRDGHRLIRLYRRTTVSHLVCARLDAASADGQPAFVMREEAYPLDQIEGVHSIVLRGDPKNIPEWNIFY
jgi:transcriptional regulator with XRE-family HTH domain